MNKNVQVGSAIQTPLLQSGTNEIYIPKPYRFRPWKTVSSCMLDAESSCLNDGQTFPMPWVSIGLTPPQRKRNISGSYAGKKRHQNTSTIRDKEKNMKKSLEFGLILMVYVLIGMISVGFIVVGVIKIVE